MIVTASLMDIRDIAAGDHTAPSSVGQTHKITEQNQKKYDHSPTDCVGADLSSS